MLRKLLWLILAAGFAASVHSQDSELTPRHFNRKGVEKQKSGALDVFCPAPVIYGTARAESDISAVIQTRIGHLIRCYSELEDGPSLKVQVRFRIYANGAVGDVQILNRNIQNGSFLACIRSIIQQLAFPSAGDKVEIEQSILFRTI